MTTASALRPRTCAIDRPLGTLANRLLVRGAGPLIRRARSFRVMGSDNLPASGALLIAANHAAFTDSAWMHLAIPRRLVVAGAKPRLFRSTATRAVMALGNVLRVDDRDSWLADVTDLLRSGRCVVTYPAFGRHPEGLGPFRPWVAELSITTGQPIVPAFIHGTTVGHTGPPWVAFGAAVSGSDPTQLTQTLRSAIHTLGQTPW